MLALKLRSCFESAAQTVADRAEEINRLNVFPVPDGDTGTNMSLTLKSVVQELHKLTPSASVSEVCQAVIHGSLMGARGNSGVITSQILRGLAEGFSELEVADTHGVSAAFKRSVKVAFQAVRKPVEGTILTVVKDVSKRLEQCDKKKLPLEETLESLVVEAYESVARTPEFLPVLKENGVVDAGGFGLAIFLEAFVQAALGKKVVDVADFAQTSADQGPSQRVEVELHNDWEGSDYRYCTEFLFHGTGLNEKETLDFLGTMGDCELLVGSEPDYKIHVHTDTPDQVLGYMLEKGQISQVHIHNMGLQAEQRLHELEAEKSQAALTPQQKSAPRKDLGFVAVASGSGNASILESLGVDEIVSGGQTMNPSTKDLLDAVKKVNAERVIILPNNKNIVMAAQSAAQACEIEAQSAAAGSIPTQVGVVPTKSIPQAFSAIFAVDLTASLEENIDLMTEALESVHDAEVTTAIKNSQAADGSPIKEGDLIGIIDGAIEVVGSSLDSVVLECVQRIQDKEEGFTLTILAGADLDDASFDELCEKLEEVQPDLEIDRHRGEQPLYPIILSIE